MEKLPPRCIHACIHDIHIQHCESNFMKNEKKVVKRLQTKHEDENFYAIEFPRDRARNSARTGAGPGCSFGTVEASGSPPTELNDGSEASRCMRKGAWWLVLSQWVLPVVFEVLETLLSRLMLLSPRRGKSCVNSVTFNAPCSCRAPPPPHLVHRHHCQSLSSLGPPGQ